MCIEEKHPHVRGEIKRRHTRKRSEEKQPRSRGENDMSLGSANSITETSPLTRGKQSRHQERTGRNGNIPAHAGKTPGTPQRLHTRWKHPRSRGENPAAHARTRPSMETSPLTRGKPQAVLLGILGERNIPAHAGKTTLVTLRPLRMRKHPRSRGENPAIKERTLELVWKHPRSRGENRIRVVRASQRVETSPLTRGKLSPFASRPSTHRNIPAHAGKTFGSL